MHNFYPIIAYHRITFIKVRGIAPVSERAPLLIDGVSADMSIQKPLSEPPESRLLGRLVMQDLRTQFRTKLLSEPRYQHKNRKEAVFSPH